MKTAVSCLCLFVVCLALFVVPEDLLAQSLTLGAVTVSGADGNNRLEPNECNHLTIELINVSGIDLTGITATLSTTNPDIVISQASSAYPDIPADGSEVNSTLFEISSLSAYQCQLADLTLDVNSSDGVDQLFYTLNQQFDYTITESSGASIEPGIDLVSSPCDDCNAFISLPFAFAFYDMGFFSAIASSNGNLQFGSSNPSFSNDCLPADFMDFAILPYWDDLTLQAPGTGIFTSVTGSEPDRIFNIEWRATILNTGEPVNFEIRLYENQPRLDFIYGAQTGDGSSATVGIEESRFGRFTNLYCNHSGIFPGKQITFQYNLCPSGTGDCSVCGAVSVFPLNLPNGFISIPYNQSVSAVGGPGPHTFTVSSGSLPSGLALNGATGVVSGTPTLNETSPFTITATSASGCQGSQMYRMDTSNCTLDLQPGPLPNAFAGQFYSTFLSAFGGVPPYTFAIPPGELPAGLTLDETTGEISGIPTEDGGFVISASVTDSMGCQDSESLDLFVCYEIVVDPPTLPPGVVGVPYSVIISASGGVPDYQFYASGLIPPGLSLDPATGEISGIPLVEGSFGVTIIVPDSSEQCFGQRQYTIVITCPDLTFDPPILPDVPLGEAYNQTIAASGGNAPYTYDVTAGLFPFGLSLNTLTGEITGVAAVPGIYNFTITATDPVQCTDTNNYTIRVVMCPTIAVLPVSLPDGGLGAPYSQLLSVAGGTGPYGFAMTAGALPDGLLLNGTTGQISGTPTVLGAFNFTVTASDVFGCAGSRSYTVNITNACLTVTVNPPALPDGSLGTPYSQTVTATGGSAPYTFAVTAGALPDGLALDANTGTISGTPTLANVFSFTITATDSTGICSGSRAYSVAVVDCLFCDDFEDGTLDLNWTYAKTSASWSESGGSLIGANIRKASAIAEPAFGGCVNCYVRATMQTAGGIGNRVWLLHHYLDKDNFVELLMKEESDVWLLKQHKAKATVAKGKASLNIDPNVPYDVRLGFDGTQYHLLIDGVPVLTLNAVLPVSGGTVGFKLKGTTATFGSIEVNP